MAVLDLLKALRHAGIEPAPFCRRLKIDTTSLEDADARVPVRSVTRLLTLASIVRATRGSGFMPGSARSPAAHCFIWSR